MRDLIGRTLGHYRIVKKIGEGGMGEVYRAHDERLDRDVAIKVLPTEVAGVQDRLERFEREAKLLASLNHPNIATLHGLEDEEHHRFLVMELVEGESLASVIARGAVPVNEAIPIALQIAKALEAAHEHGIIHRDLKPANVMIESGNQVKVLDFGLAKAFEPEGSGPESPESLAESPTLTADLTRGGVLLGTAAYMSPEQARGKPVDKRADIWAFGCTFYEMLTRSRPFGGTTSTEILASIIKEPPEWDALPQGIPAAVRRLLTRCLTKDPGERLHDIADARLVLQSVASGEYDREETVALPTPHAGWRGWLPWGLAAVFACLAVAILIWFLTASPPVVTRTSIMLPSPEALSTAGGISLSPDGRWFAYVVERDGVRQLYLRDLGQFDATPIPDTEGAHAPFFSPDSQWLGFFAGHKLRKVSVTGGVPLTLCETEGFSLGATWGEDDTILFATDVGVYISTQGSKLFRIAAEGGMPEELSTPDERLMFGSPQLLPGGNDVLLTRLQHEGWGGQAAMLSLEKREWIELKGLGEATEVRYLPTGHLLFIRSGQLVTVPFDLELRKVRRSAITVLDSVYDVGSDFPTLGLPYFAVSKTGSLVYVPASAEPINLVWVNREGLATPLREEANNSFMVRLSPDGMRVAIVRIDQSTWIYDVERGTSTRLLSGGGADAIWTADGTRVTLALRRSDSYNIFWMPADGSEEAEPLLVREHDQFPHSWSPDGTLAYYEVNPETQRDIWTLRPGDEPLRVLATPFNERSPTFSPNGRFLAYVSDESGKDEVYVRSYPDVGEKWTISSGGGREPVWSHDGRELIYRRGRQVWSVPILIEPTFSAKSPQLLFEGPYLPRSNTSGSQFYDVSPDGKHLLMLRSGRQQAQTEIRIVLHWFQELKRLVPNR
jgi:serine/threonine-protein kinase